MRRPAVRPLQQLQQLQQLLPLRLAPRLLLLALLALLPFAALLALDQWRDASLGRERALSALRTATLAAAADMDRTLRRSAGLLTLLAEREAIRGLDPRACTEQLRGLDSLTPLLSNLAVVDADGRVVCQTRRDAASLPGLHQRPWVQRALASGAVEVGKPLLDPGLQRPVLGLARRIDDSSGRGALLVLSLNLAAQRDEDERLGLPLGARLWIEDADGTPVSGLAAPHGEGDLALSQALERPGWRARLEVPAAQVYGSIDRELRWGLLLLAAVLLATLALVARLARHIAGPMVELAELSRQAAAGWLQGRAREDLPGEAGQLGRAFNTMLSARAKAEAAMRESERHYRDMLEQSGLLAVALDERGRVSYCNPGFAALVGEAAEALVGRDWIRHFLPPERQAERAELFDSGRAGRIRGQSRRELLLADGSRRTVVWSSAPRLGDAGEVVGLMLMGQDVTEAEQAVRQQARSRDMYSALWRSSRQLVRGGQDAAALCRENCAAAVENGHARLAAAWLPEAPGSSILRPWGHAGPLAQVLGMAEPRLDPGDIAIAGTPAARVMRSGQAVVSNDYLAVARSLPWFERARAAGIRSVAALPLRRGGRVVGVFTVHMSEPDWFDPALLALMQALADDLGFGLDQIDRRQAHAAAVAQASASLERFRLAAATGNVWAWESASNRFGFQHAVLPGFRPPGGPGSSPRDWFELIVEADRPRLRRALVGHLRRRRPLDIELRARGVDGVPRLLLLRGQALWGLDGRVVQMAGTVFDLTARRGAGASA